VRRRDVVEAALPPLKAGKSIRYKAPAAHATSTFTDSTGRSKWDSYGRDRQVQGGGS